MSKRYIDIAEVAKIIRRELRVAFPGTTFSVRSERYSMGCHITVRWEDGPSIKAVEAITDQRYGSSFDSMTDSSISHDTEFNGELVHFAGSRPYLQREITPAFEQSALRAWEALGACERAALLNHSGFPLWPESRPGYRLATFMSKPSSRFLSAKR